MKTARGPGTLLIHLCDGKTWSSDPPDKGGPEAGGGGQVWACPQGPRRTWVCSSFTVFTLHCPGAPSSLLGYLTETPSPLGGRGVQGWGPPHAPPPHRAHCLWTQGTNSDRCSPFMGTQPPWGGLCQGRPAARLGQLRVGPSLISSPKMPECVAWL